MHNTPEIGTVVSLKVAEHFSSIQGEGLTAGIPAVFLRLSMCNFNCRWCDTVEVWRRGEHMDFDRIDALFEVNGYYTQLRKGAHLVLTGGDPMIQQQGLENWIARLEVLGRQPYRIFMEVETQGYILPTPKFAPFVRQWNVSPKLANSGMALDKRIQAKVLKWHAQGANSIFKFPVVGQEDMVEVEKIVRDFDIRRQRVYLMPVCSSKAELDKASPAIVTMAKASGFRFSSRLQLAIYDKATGV